MEPSFPKCNYCGRNSFECIQFSCNHQLCLGCSPYLILNNMEKTLNPSNFITIGPKILRCIQCQKGFSEISHELLEKILNFKVSSKSQFLCSWCEDSQSNYICEECDNVFCEKCLEHSHKSKKSYQNHKILPLGQTPTQQSTFSKKCTCSSPLKITKICVDCEKCVCDFCNNFEHLNHRFMELQEFWDSYDRLEKNKAKEKISKYIEEDFMKMNNDIPELNILTQKYIDEITKIMVDLRNIKAKIIEKILAEKKNFSNQLLLLKSSLNSLKEDLDSNIIENLNKSYFLFKFCSKENFSDFNTIRITSNKLILDKLNWIYDSLKNLFEANNIFLLENEIQPNIMKNDEVSDPFFMIGGKEINLSVFTNTITSFVRNNENFIAFSNDKYKIQLYNLNENKYDDIALDGHSVPIVSLSYFKLGSKNFFYSCDENFILNVWNLDSYKFEIEWKLHDFSNGAKVRKCIVFVDKFLEINNSFDDYSLFLSSSLNNYFFPIRILNKKGKICREIEKNDFLNVEYCYDELNSKTKFFFANQYGISIYDLKLNLVVKEINLGLSLFLFKVSLDDKSNRLLKNMIYFIKIENSGYSNRHKLGKINLENYQKTETFVDNNITDLLIWDRQKYMITIEDTRYIVIRSIKDFSVLMKYDKLKLPKSFLFKTSFLDEKKGEVQDNLILIENDGSKLGQLKLFQKILLK